MSMTPQPRRARQKSVTASDSAINVKVLEDGSVIYVEKDFRIEPTDQIENEDENEDHDDDEEEEGYRFDDGGDYSFDATSSSSSSSNDERESYASQFDRHKTRRKQMVSSFDYSAERERERGRERVTSQRGKESGDDDSDFDVEESYFFNDGEQRDMSATRLWLCVNRAGHEFSKEAWAFTVPLVLITHWPNNIVAAAVFALVSHVAVLVASPWIARRMVGDLRRVRLMHVCLATMIFGAVAASLMLLLLLWMNADDGALLALDSPIDGAELAIDEWQSFWSDWHNGVVYALLCAFGALNPIMSRIVDTVLEHDWLPALFVRTERPAATKTLERVTAATRVVTPLIVGVLLTESLMDMRMGLIAVASLYVGSLLLMFFAFWRLQKSVGPSFGHRRRDAKRGRRQQQQLLAAAAAKDDAVDLNGDESADDDDQEAQMSLGGGDDDNNVDDDSGVARRDWSDRLRDRFPNAVTYLYREWPVYSSQVVFLVLLANLILWVTIFNPHSVILIAILKSYDVTLKNRTVLANAMLGLFRAVGATFGFGLGNLSFMGVMLRCGLIPATLSFVVGAAVSALVAAVLFQLASLEIAIYALTFCFLVAVVIFRLAVVGFAAGQIQILRAGTSQRWRTTLEVAQRALTDISLIVVFVLAAGLSIPSRFPIIVWLSFCTVLFAAALFLAWSRNRTARNIVLLGPLN
jgi:Ferroportin1 (FPN1)